MTLELLVSCVSKDVHELVKTMNIESDAIIVNQKSDYSFEQFDFGGNRITALSMQEKGVGLSRTTALQRATDDIVLFSDEDIVYESGYSDMVMKAFEENPKADIILFNVVVEEDRRTYWTDAVKSVHWWNCGRYPAYSIAVRTKRLHEVGLTYHLWFGGGALYSCGEDSLFLNEALKLGLKIMAVPVTIGKEVTRTEGEASTWFSGYNEKFFYDRGVLYYYLYGKLAPIMTFRFLRKNRAVMCKDISYAEAKKLMKRGAKERTPWNGDKK